MAGWLTPPGGTAGPAGGAVSIPAPAEVVAAAAAPWVNTAGGPAGTGARSWPRTIADPGATDVIAPTELPDCGNDPAIGPAADVVPVPPTLGVGPARPTVGAPLTSWAAPPTCCCPPARCGAVRVRYGSPAGGTTLASVEGPPVLLTAAVVDARRISRRAARTSKCAFSAKARRMAAWKHR
jgi:hypothetical protein